jgi:hypothetical protein
VFTKFKFIGNNICLMLFNFDDEVQYVAPIVRLSAFEQFMSTWASSFCCINMSSFCVHIQMKQESKSSSSSPCGGAQMAPSGTF